MQPGEDPEESSGSDGAGKPSRKEPRGLISAAGNDLLLLPLPRLSTIPLRTEPQLRASIKSRLILILLKARQVKKVQMEELLKTCPEASSTGKKFLEGVRGKRSDRCRKEDSGTPPCPFCSDVSGFSSSWNPKDSLNNNKIYPFVQRTLNTKVKRTEPRP